MKKWLLTALVAPALCALGSSPVVAEDTGSTGLTQRSLNKIARAKATPKKKNTNVDFKKVCKSVSPLKKSLLKNAFPGHIQRTDPRAPGFAFVCGPDCPKKFPVSAYYSTGELAFKLGYYGKWEGNGRPRAYCGAGGVSMCNVSSVQRKARGKGYDGKIYLDYGNGSCRSATPGARNGSPF